MFVQNRFLWNEPEYHEQLPIITENPAVTLPYWTLFALQIIVQLKVEHVVFMLVSRSQPSKLLTSHLSWLGHAAH